MKILLVYSSTICRDYKILFIGYDKRFIAFFYSNKQKSQRTPSHNVARTNKVNDPRMQPSFWTILFDITTTNKETNKNNRALAREWSLSKISLKDIQNVYLGKTLKPYCQWFSSRYKVILFLYIAIYILDNHTEKTARVGYDSLSYSFW